MTGTATIDTLGELRESLIGGKGLALAVLRRKGVMVPDTGIITTEAYGEYVTRTGLKERIALELNRKDFEDMRWEEMWDASLRIRNFFLSTPFPEQLSTILREFVSSLFSDEYVVVRSSAPGEDSATTSFAGIHESFVDVRGVDEILDHVRLVWASLWSDKALLYRRELKLTPEGSSMAVLIQKTIRGKASGVAFSVSPIEKSQGVVESVFGLNQDLVDGTVEPYRWVFNRESKDVVSVTAPRESNLDQPDAEGGDINGERTRLETAPLTEDEALRVFSHALQLEKAFGKGQDIEWTLDGRDLVVLQSRPITTTAHGDSRDSRTWYLSLSRSVNALFELMERIERDLIPAMVEEAAGMASKDLQSLSQEDLVREISLRFERYKYWKDIYWSDFIPFAHGMRVFGELYNNTLRPEDPYEFVTLLSPDKMESLERNELLEEMASMVRENKALKESLSGPEISIIDNGFHEKVNLLLDRFGHQFSSMASPSEGSNQFEMVIAMVLKMASRPPTARPFEKNDCHALEERFLDRFEEQEKNRAIDMLKLARASYRLRDDDNIHLGRIEGALQSAINEGRKRISADADGDSERRAASLVAVLGQVEVPKQTDVSRSDTIPSEFTYKARQIVGQPAGPGFARGTARVIHNKSDLLTCGEGEILVCDAIDPEMTFVIPLVEGIVERRGGMLIHGAIIAREYGIPCVTGIGGATRRIRTGDSVTVDGYLGIVTIG